jgi:flagellar biogenesis protein FliO
MTTPSSTERMSQAPATGSDYPPDTELMPGEEPITTGTVFLTSVILMIILAIWIIVYRILLER